MNPKILRNSIQKGNAEWVKLYRYIWLKSQANYLGVFPTPKTFALATCTDFEADEICRNRMKTEMSLPPARTKDSVEMQIVKNERTIVISDLPLYWRSPNNGNRNDISTAAQGWGWNSVQQYSPEDYSPKASYLEQPCLKVAKLLEQATRDDELDEATIHIWVSMTDIVNYAKTKGNSVSFPVKEDIPELSSYFMKCLQLVADGGKKKNPIIVNINASGEFLNCEDESKFKRVSKSIVGELRSEGYMVTWGGPLWKELFPFIDAHGRIRIKGNPEKMVAMGALEKQLYREKTIMKCMFPTHVIIKMDHLAASSGIAKHEGLVDDPPEEFKFEDVNAIPLDKKDEKGGSGRGRKVRPSAKLGEPTAIISTCTSV